MEKSSILEMARGAIMEQCDIEVGKIVDNIIDVNTVPNKKRQLVLTIDFLPSSDRSVVVVTASAKSKLLPCNAIQTSLYVGANGDGEVVATEMTANMAGQFALDGSEEPEAAVLKMVKEA